MPCLGAADDATKGQLVHHYTLLHGTIIHYMVHHILESLQKSIKMGRLPVKDCHKDSISKLSRWTRIIFTNTQGSRFENYYTLL